VVKRTAWFNATVVTFSKLFSFFAIVLVKLYYVVVQCITFSFTYAIIEYICATYPRALSRLLHTELHWLYMYVPERVVYKLGVMVFNCLHSQASQYLVELCQPVAGVASQQHLRSATRQLLVIPRHQLSSYGRRAFCVSGPSVWNSLPDSLRNPITGGNSFRQSLKTYLFAAY